MINNQNLISLYLSGIASLCLSCNESPMKIKPNVIIILADDMGWGDIGANGNKLVKTPVLDGLKEKSLSFDRFYVCPLCAPTRSEILTGRYFLRTGVSSVTRGYENMRTGEVTIAEILKDNGYKTGCFGKWHNGGYYLQHPNRQGFDEFTGFCMGHLGYYFDGPFLHNDEEIRSNGYTTDFFTDQALEFIEGNRDNPFFCYLAYNVPHSPFQVPSAYFDRYRSMGLDSTLSSVYGMVSNMDDNIGRVIGKLEEEKLTEKTLLIFLSDNGPNTERFNGNMKGRKGSVDEGGIRVPFYMCLPGIIKPGVTDQLAQDIDILPTLLGFLNIDFKPVNRIDGIDLTGIIKENRPAADRFIFSRQANQQIGGCSGSIRNDRYRLVRTTKDTLLYDLMSDPEQKKDISGSETKIAQELSAILNTWEKELVTAYKPVTTIEAGFPEEKSFTLPVQDAKLSGRIRYSSIHPNQSYTQGWNSGGDSLYWTLNIHTGGTFLAEIQYGCSLSQTGSKFILSTGDASQQFNMALPFESVVLPERDYVKRSESVERTWSRMPIGRIPLKSGEEKIVLKLTQLAADSAGIIRSIRFTRQ
jgi:arylsulfatase A